MIDYNEKFDRRVAPIALRLDHIEDLVRPYLQNIPIRDVSLLEGGFVNSNYRLRLINDASLVLRISARSATEFRKELRALRLVQGVVPVPKTVAENYSITDNQPIVSNERIIATWVGLNIEGNTRIEFDWDW
jgi:hypothetical protein